MNGRVFLWAFPFEGESLFLLQNEFLLQTKKQRSLAIRMVGERWGR